MTQNPAAVPEIVADAEIDRATCLVLLASSSLGRLVFTHQALPDVRPVHYRLDGENILINLPVGSTASRASRNTIVAFTVDDFDLAGPNAWSVTAVGSAHEVLEPEAGTQAPITRRTAWPEVGPTSLFCVTAQRITGHRIRQFPVTGNEIRENGSP